MILLESDFEKGLDTYLEQTSVFPHLILEDVDDPKVKSMGKKSRYHSPYLVRRKKLERSIQNSIKRYWAKERN